MDLQTLRDKILEVNGRISACNETRSKNIGVRTVLQQQLNTACAEYEKKFGIKLDTTDINQLSNIVSQELKTVTDTLESDYGKMAMVLDFLETGKIEEAKQILSGDVAVATASDSTSEQAPTPAPATQPTLAPQSTQEQGAPYAPNPAVPTPAIIMPESPQMGTPSDTVIAKPVNVVGASSLVEGFTQNPTPTAPASPTLPETPKPVQRPVSSFGDILNGSAFDPSKH